MSRLSKSVKLTHNDSKEAIAASKSAVTNFMGGTSYEINPIDTLKIVCASSIFGEPQYYRDGEFAEKTINDGVYKVDALFNNYAISALDKYKGAKTSDMMEKIIDDALAYDYEKTLECAVMLREEKFMRLNPQIIMVRAALMTDKRIDFTEKHPGKFNEINQKVMKRADDVIAQATYYLYQNYKKKDIENKRDAKKGIPGILKRSWADKINSLSTYEIYKYRNHGIGLIDVTRLSHANNDKINELMKTGTIEINDSSRTWENLRAEGKTWEEITSQIKMPHMALLRNLRGIFSEIEDTDKLEALLENLKGGVEKGMQFPFRYYSALNALSNVELSGNEMLIKDALEECIDKSCENMPMLKGNNAFLTDNSGSAWGTTTSEYGKICVAAIDNLSAVIGAANSEKGTVVAFGDKMIKYPISKRQGILEQTKNITADAKRNVGMSTENGIWLFFKEAIDNKITYDNIAIYSDMQAGHGGLYGKEREDYIERGFNVSQCRREYIDVAKLIDEYRRKVNPKVNIMCVQTAGYDNVVVPEIGYRTVISGGWTGKEIVALSEQSKIWDEIELRQTEKKKLVEQEIPADKEER